MQKKTSFFQRFYVAILSGILLPANPGDHDFFL